MKETIKKSLIGGLIFSLTSLTVFVAYATIDSVWTNPSTIVASMGTTLTASSWNQVLSNLNNLDNKITNLSSATAMSSGAIMGFYLSHCPTGWIAADGTNSTPDLRGAFIRGIGGDINSRDVVRTLGDYQTDAFASHSHQYENNKSGHGLREGTLDRNTYEKPRKTYTNYNTTAVGGTETRPKNIALLYCMKQ